MFKFNTKCIIVDEKRFMAFKTLIKLISRCTVVFCSTLLKPFCLLQTQLQVFWSLSLQLWTSRLWILLKLLLQNSSLSANNFQVLSQSLSCRSGLWLDHDMTRSTVALTGCLGLWACWEVNVCPVCSLLQPLTAFSLGLLYLVPSIFL